VKACAPQWQLPCHVSPVEGAGSGSEAIVGGGAGAGGDRRVGRSGVESFSGVLLLAKSESSIITVSLKTDSQMEENCLQRQHLFGKKGREISRRGR
jgi:hypothetical protein